LKETSPSQSKTADQSGDQSVSNLMDVDFLENSGKHFEYQTNEQSNQHDDQQISNYKKTKPFKLCVKVDKFPGLNTKKKILMQKFIVQQGIVFFSIPQFLINLKILLSFM
jgi:hypothetical protein